MRIAKFVGMTATALVLGLAAAEAAPAAAGILDSRVVFQDRRIQRDGGRQLALQLEATTDRLEDAFDGRRGYRGRDGRQLASGIDRMEDWAGYFRASVEREGFRSLKARQRFDRFLVEYHAVCDELDRVRRPYLRDDIESLHRTVAQLSGAYGMHVARGGRDRDRDRDWDDDGDWRDRDRDGRRH